jgi:hypothetical protein
MTSLNINLLAQQTVYTNTRAKRGKKKTTNATGVEQSKIRAREKQKSTTKKN